MSLHELKTPLLTAAFVLAGLLLYSFASPFLPWRTQPISKEALFTADGTAEVSYVPDTALLYLGVNKKAATQEEAKNEANKVINKIVEDLKKLGIDKKYIKTTNFSVNEDYDYSVMPVDAVGTQEKMMIAPDRRPKIRGYVANASVEVRVKPLEKAEQAIDAATKAGATQVGTSQLIVDEEEQKKLEADARIQAITNAKVKAQEISKAAGIRLGRVVSVQEGGSGGYPRTMMLKAESAADATAPVPATELNAGENKISISVTLSYETY